MAKFVYGLNQSLDGYVDHDKFAPGPQVFRHFIEQVRGQAGALYGRHLYGLMQYWDEDQPEWGPDEHEYATVWRRHHKWVVSRSLTSVGPNATLIQDNVEAAVRKLKAEVSGEIEVAGPTLAQSLIALGLIDEYRIYLHPVVLGHGKPFFASPPPPLRFVSSERVGEDVVQLTYVPA
jgi:dihydrofolate reductase